MNGLGKHTIGLGLCFCNLVLLPCHAQEKFEIYSNDKGTYSFLDLSHNSWATDTNQLFGQTGVSFGRQSQMELSGRWGSLSLTHQSDGYHDESDQKHNGTGRSSSRFGLGLGNASNTEFTTSIEQYNKPDNPTSLPVKYYSLAYAFRLSATSKLFISRTRCDNSGSVVNPFSSLSGGGSKGIQVGLRQTF